MNPFGGRGVTVGGSNVTSMFPAENAYDEIQKKHQEEITREKSKDPT